MTLHIAVALLSFSSSSPTTRTRRGALALGTARNLTPALVKMESSAIQGAGIVTVCSYRLEMWLFLSAIN